MHLSNPLEHRTDRLFSVVIPIQIDRLKTQLAKATDAIEGARLQTDNYRAHSLITYVANVTSPVLLLHGANDTRVPPEQSVEFYRAQKDLGKEVTFVRFPREGHGLSEPQHQMDRLRRYAEFFGEHVDNPPISERQQQATDTTEEGEEA